MPTVGAQPGKREVHLSVELKLWFNDLKSLRTLFVTRDLRSLGGGGGSCVLASNDLVHNIIRYVFDMIRQVLGIYRYSEITSLRVFPSVSLLYGLLFGKGEILLGDGFVIAEGREIGRASCRERV